MEGKRDKEEGGRSKDNVVSLVGGQVRGREQHLPAERLGNTMYEVTVTSVGAVGLLRLVAVPDVADARRQAGGGGHDGGGDHGDGG